MKPMEQTVNNTYDPCVVHLMLTEGEIKLAAKDAQRFMEEIWSRATEIGPVLEGILHDPHCKPQRNWPE
jgi:hypothetical protein